jgi:hypothetical protein
MKKGLALEPLDVDLMIDGRDMTQDEREKLSAFIEKNKPDARLKKKLDALRKRLGQLPSAPTWKELIAAQDTRKDDDVLDLEHSVEAAISGERDLSATDRRRIAEKIERYRTALDTDMRRAKKSRRAPLVQRARAKVKR